MQVIRRRSGFCSILAGVAMVMLTVAAPAAFSQESAFAPAFGEEALDLPHCRQFINGQGSPANPEQVKRTFGFYPAASNWEDRVWEIAGGVDGVETTYGFLTVLKQPVGIGSLSITPADIGAKGSSSGGQLFYLKPGVAGGARSGPDAGLGFGRICRTGAASSFCHAGAGHTHPRLARHRCPRAGRRASALSQCVSPAPAMCERGGGRIVRTGRGGFGSGRPAAGQGVAVEFPKQDHR